MSIKLHITDEQAQVTRAALQILKDLNYISSDGTKSKREAIMRNCDEVIAIINSQSPIEFNPGTPAKTSKKKQKLHVLGR